MIDRTALLADLRAAVAALQDDIRARIDEVPELAAHLAGAHERAVAAERTALALHGWREGEITQAAVSWVLACVFVRFCEDNGLIDEPLLSGPGPRRTAGLGRRDEHFRAHPEHSDREYLAWVFDQAARFPALAPLYDHRHTPLWRLGPSADGAKALHRVWTAIDPDTGDLIHDFTDPELGTRFLGDLYQDLSDEAKKRYALLQTPVFVEEFILDRTLEPAIDESGLDVVRMIDPTCGSGHFLIGAFERLFARWREREPATEVTVLAQRSLDAVHGVDLNPYATAIARFRLVVAALRACGIRRLAEAPAFKLNLATGDSLIHARPERGQFTGFEAHDLRIAHVYDTEDADELRRILGRGYHVVVGNPPYINVADAALRDAYRRRYESCHGKYALSVPFMERFFELAHVRDEERPEVAGYVGKITANSFMKREFGDPLVERFLPGVDVTTIVDTSGAYIPGHGTPTLILFGRARPPVAGTIRVLDAVRGEPSKPTDPVRGEVWTSILLLVDRPGEEDRFIRSSDVVRGEFASHPVTLGIGRDLRKQLDREAAATVGRGADSLGITSFTLEDDIYLLPRGAARRRGVEAVRAMVEGDIVRDWAATVPTVAVFPYDERIEPLAPAPNAAWWRHLWPGRTNLSNNRMFGGKTKVETGLAWYEFGRLTASKLRTPLTITFAFVATHNHFVLDRGGTVFNRSAPVIKLPAFTGMDEHLGLLGVLNSATACFWLKQVCHNKGSTVDDKGARQRTAPFEDFFEFTGTKLADFPLPDRRTVALPRRLDSMASERAALLDHLPATDLRAGVAALRDRDAVMFAHMVSWQEELDWQVMAAFALVPDDLPLARLDAPPLRLGERAFEIVLARQVARGETETTWFERHRSTPITELPAHWPSDYRDLVQRRIELIESDPNVGLIERPEHKRRWAGRSFDDRLNEALRNLVLDRLEEPDLWSDLRLKPISELADIVRADARLVDACALIAGSSDVDVGDAVKSLVLDQAVPFLAAYRHTDAGLRKRAIWERVWDLQRAEDRIDARTELPEGHHDRLTKAQANELKADEVGRIPVPPRYAKSDFRQVLAWNLRGKLDVPKERFVLVPGAERGANPSPIVGWAGWDERARARALAARILELQESEAAGAGRLTPLLAGVLELLPWIHQWHPESDPEYGHQPAGAYLEDWLDGMLSSLGLTRDALRNWRAPAPSRGRGRRATTTTTAA